MFFFMSIKTSLFVYVYIFTVLPRLSDQNTLYVFNTEDNDSVEYYDCFILDTIPYCRRPGFPINLHRNNGTFNCFHKGKPWRFEELRSRNITPSQVVHDYRSSIEKAEEYALFLSGHMNSSSLCECPKKTFGKNCEYQFVSLTQMTTFADSRKWQNAQKKMYRLEMQAYQIPLCYNTLICDYGLLCLDWRDICDGRQQCMNGTDEEACDLLEFNECEKDEYRCSNGMCIPDIYFLDGEYDCMDYSDEQRPFDHNTCAYQPDPLNCDEHICAVNEWSCGDGQCINERNRYEWQEYATTSNIQCHSMREYMYMCELSVRFKLWTSTNGTCYDSSIINLIKKTSNESNQTLDQYCLYLTKCILSDNLERNCPCKRLNCSIFMTQNCSLYIQYPAKGLLTPYLIAIYTTERKWSRNKQPHFYTMLGSIKCRGYHGHRNTNDQIIWLLNNIDKRNIYLEDLFCGYADTVKDVHGPQYHSSCYANTSYTLGQGLPYAFLDVCKQCISQYRINDGVQDCLHGEDERPQKSDTCINPVRHHRYQCSAAPVTCLVVTVLGDSIRHCNESDDELDYKSGQSLSMTICEQFEDEGCRFLREYISKSRYTIDNSIDLITNAKMPFRSYCDTFWDLKDKSDESLGKCRSWLCPIYEFQCRSGQCIHTSYVCDGEWDCSDASDELFDINDLDDHNQMLDLTKKYPACIITRINRTQPFSSFCNITTEYPCLLINFTDQTDLLYTQPCINISQIGDNKIDCLGGIDERNTQTHCNHVQQLGFAFQCRSTPSVCISEQNLCANTSRCLNEVDDSALCGNHLNSCSNLNDFLCFNGICMNNVRCNGEIECKYGEDEYGCNPQIGQTDSKYYRILKRQNQINVKKSIALPTFPSAVSAIKNITNKEKKTVVKRNIPATSNISMIALMCNRGVATLHYTNTIKCFCPPSYYGEYCEYHSDRITSYVHLDISHSHHERLTINSNITIKILILLIYENEIIHNRQFHVRSIIDFDQIVKKKNHLLYSRNIKLLEAKMFRRLNRTSIVNHTSYYLRYEAYELRSDSSIYFVGVWQYPIYFDFLPSFRFSKILRFHDKQPEFSQSPCESNPCNSSNAECHILQNDPINYICLCKSGYSGKNCSIQDLYCANNYCTSTSWCMSTYLGSTAGNRLPFCLCPLNVYGTRCGLIYDQCLKSPCKNDGTCYTSTSDMSKANCVCHKDYHGTTCELKKEAFNIVVHGNNISGLSVIQYFYIDFYTLTLIFAYQNISEHRFHHLHYRYTKLYAPPIVLLKNYISGITTYPKIFLLSLAINAKNINSSINLTDKNLCWNIAESLKNIQVYQYHDICRNRSFSPHPLCFFDDQYLCFCEVNNYRAECFIYDHKLDKCDQCFSNGRCIRGNLEKDDEYLCICPECYYGHRCQYSSEHFSFTFEQIFTHGLSSTETITRQLTFYCMILVACISFIIGGFSNIFTFVTFYRSKFLRSGVGNYLLVGSVVNQITLFSLTFRLIHVTMSATGRMNTVNDTINKILCKSVPYALTSSGQLSYWLMSTVAIERLYITWNIRGVWLKKPCIARRIIFLLTLIVLIINGSQIAFYTALVDIKMDMKRMVCVLIYSNNFWIRLNQVNHYINSLLPLIINIICTSGIMFLIARQKMLANQKSALPMTITNKQTISETNDISIVHNISPIDIDNTNEKQYWYVQIKRRWIFFRTVLRENSDLIFGPAITILPQLFSLPELILSTTMNCDGFHNAAVRYAFIVSLSVLYIPQMVSFLLYVKPSSVYYAHFRSTFIGKKIFLLLNCFRRQTERQNSYSKPSRYMFSNTIRFENSIITDNIIQH